MKTEHGRRRASGENREKQALNTREEKLNESAALKNNRDTAAGNSIHGQRRRDLGRAKTEEPESGGAIWKGLGTE
jgi:hypothetical protein